MAQSKVLITGGAGFIGSNIADKLIHEGYSVVVVDNFSSGKRENINPQAKVYDLDIRAGHLEEIFDKERPNFVSHHAAQIDVRKSVSNPINDLDINGKGLLNILECSRKFDVSKIIYASSGGAVYGEPKSLPVEESHQLKPQSPYGVTKLLGELYLDFYGKTYGLKYTALRYSNVYGPRQDSHGEAGVIDIFAEAMLRGDRPKIFGDGEQIRDYVFVGDIVNANFLSLTKGDFEAINIGTSKKTSVNDLFNIIKKETSFEGQPVYTPEKLGELKENYLNYQKANLLLGWAPCVPLEEGIPKTIRWIKEVRHGNVNLPPTLLKK